MKKNNIYHQKLIDRNKINKRELYSLVNLAIENYKRGYQDSKIKEKKDYFIYKINEVSKVFNKKIKG